MIDLASFYTTQNSNVTQTGGEKLSAQLAALKLIAANKAEAKEKEAEASAGGFSIFDLLMTTIEDTIANGDTSLNSDGDQDSQLDLTRILAGNDRIAGEVEGLDDTIGLSLIEKVEQTLALNQQVFDNIIKAGTGNDDLQIDKETGEIIVPDVAETLNILSNKASDIASLVEQLDLNTINLTPNQITQLQDIQAGIVPTEAQAQEVQNTLQTILNGLVAIVPPTVRSDIVIPPQALKASGKPASLELAQPASQANDSNARLNSFSEGEIPLPFKAGDSIEGEADFDALLANAKGKKIVGGSNGDVLTNTNAANTPQNNAAAQQPTFNVLQAWPFASSGSLLGSPTFSDQVAEQLGLSLNGQQSVAQGSLSALVNQAQSAAQSHPATQMVAASMTKSGLNGQDTNISLRLDPPGLGRVDVSMTFTKDKTMKAVVIIEKPEAHIMLQRDAQILERALQDAGLDTDGGLSFELAEHGFDFDQHNQRGGGHDNGRTGGVEGQDGEELEIIETTMNWRVDPETGHMRYDILA